MSTEYLGLPRSRVLVLHALFGLLFAVLLGGFAWRQVLEPDRHRERERVQSLRRLLDPAPRGRLLDRHGRVLARDEPAFEAVVHLAELRPEFRTAYRRRAAALAARGQPRPPGLEEAVRAAVVQGHLDDANRLAGRTARVDSAALERHFATRQLLPFPVLTELRPDEVARLVEQLPADHPVSLRTRPVRRYPQGPAAAHVLGYVNEDDLDPEDSPVAGTDLMTFGARQARGAAGMEAVLEDRLGGRPGGRLVRVDPTGRTDQIVESRPPVAGQDVHLSLDLAIQLAAERAMEGEQGAAVALDVRTGEVLAMVSRPGYDADRFATDRAATIARMNADGAWTNRAIQGLYPPGSTFKLVTALAGLRAGLLTPEYTVDCHGALPIGRATFPCHNRNGHGPVTLVEAIRVSCNVYFYQVGLDLGIDSLAGEARRLGLDRPTGIELPYENNRMLVPDPGWKLEAERDTWFPGDTANTTIGQGYLRVTPLQMACFTGALATGHTLLRPTLLALPPGRGAATPAARGDLGITPEQRALLLEGMEQASVFGTARLARVNGLSIAAKTGTAQVRLRDGTAELAWTVAFAPLDDPQVAVAIVLEGVEPDREYAGGLKAAPVAQAILAACFGRG